MQGDIYISWYISESEFGAEFVKCDFYYCSFPPSCENVGERHLILQVFLP